MAEFAAEFFPLRVVDGEESVLNLEGVLVVYTEVGAGEFWSPIGEIFSIEELDPVFFFGFLGVGDPESENGEEKLFFEHGERLVGGIRQCNGHSSGESAHKKTPSRKSEGC